MTDLSRFVATASTVPVRVRWVEYPACLESGHDTENGECPVCEGRGCLPIWEGVFRYDDHQWSLEPGMAVLPEKQAAEMGMVKDGTVLAIARDLLVVAAEDGHILTLPVENVRSLSSAPPRAAEAVGEMTRMPKA